MTAPTGEPPESDTSRPVVPTGSERAEPELRPVMPPTHLEAAATAVFGVRVDRAAQFAGLLAGTGVRRGLLGPREVDRIWDRHLLNCAVVGEFIPEGAQVADVGSGAGLPGLALALARPDLDVVLIEPLLRRSEFLDEAVSLLGLSRVQVRRARAEELPGARPFPDGRAADVVTSRAVAPLPRLAAWCLPLLRPGGTMLALKGDRAEAETFEAAAVLRRLGARRWEVLRAGVDLLSAASTVVRVELGDEAVPSGLARRVQREGARARRSGR